MAAPKRDILDLEPGLVGSLPARCASCCFWESSGAGSPGQCRDRGLKADWISTSLEAGFAPGKMVRSGGVTLGYAQFTHVGLIPRLSEMPYPRPSEDAVYITCIYVVPEMRGIGLGKLLLDSVERTLYKRKARLLETHGLSAGRTGPPAPGDFFAACGFKAVTPHLEAPLMRLDLRSLVPWQESIQALLERIPLPMLSRGKVPRLERPL